MTWLLQHAADALIVAGGMVCFALGHDETIPLPWVGGAVFLLAILAALLLDPGAFARESLDARTARWRTWFVE